MLALSRRLTTKPTLPWHFFMANNPLHILATQILGIQTTNTNKDKYRLGREMGWIEDFAEKDQGSQQIFTHSKVKQSNGV